MSDKSIWITTLDDVSNSDDEMLSLREAFACAIACAQSAPEEEEPIVIAFSSTLFQNDAAIVELQSPLSIPAGALCGRSLIITAPDGKSVVIQTPQGCASWCDDNENVVVLENVATAPAVMSMAASPLLAAAANVDHIYVDPDYTEEELNDSHFRTIADAVTAHPDYTGSITVEKENASTTIGALICPGKIFGGAVVTGGTHTVGSALEVAVGAEENGYFRFLAGGCYVTGAEKTVVKVVGDSSLTIGGEGTIDTDFAFGGIYLASGTASIYGASSLSISSGTFHSVVCGGHIAGGASTLIRAQNTSSCTLTISGGVFLKEVAAGSYNQAGQIVGRHVTDTLTISGGTFYKSVYGGNIARTQALAKAINEASLIDMTVNSSVSVTIDSSSNPIEFQKNIVLGSRYQGKIQGDTQMIFSGYAENLVFSSTTLVIGDSDSASDEEHRINGARNLVFDSYRSSGTGAGEFAPLDIFAFDRLTLKNNSNVSFSGNGQKGTGFDLSSVQYWNFEYGSTLEWSKGTNDFYGDAMTITLNGQSVESPWTIISGSDDTLLHWNYMGLNSTYPVTIDGVAAKWDKANNCFATSDYKLYRDGNSLKLATLA